MKNALLQPGAKGVCLRLLACLLTFTLVSASVFCVFEIGFADENDVGIEDIQLVNADNPSESYGFWSSSDKVKTITINNKGGQVNLMCVAWWWPDGSNSSDPPSTTLVSSDENIVSVYGMTITAVHDGDAYLTLTVSENTVSGEPLTLVVPVHVTGQDAVYVESMGIYCEEAEEYQYDGTGYLTIETETLYEIYLHFYLIVTAVDPATGERIDYDTRYGQLSLQNPDLADPEWHLTDENLGVISDDGMFHPTEYGINSIWAGSYGGLDGAFVRTGEIRCNFPDPEQNDPEAHPQDGITFNAWYENYSGENNSMPDDPNLVYSDYYDLNRLEYVKNSEGKFATFTETYTLVSGINATAVTAQGYGVDLESLLVEACSLDPDQGVGAIETLRFYDHSGAYKEMSASWLFQTRYYYPNIDMGSTAGTGVRIVKPMLAFDSWWQRGNIINWDAEMTDSTRFRLLFGSTSASESVTGFSWKWVNRVDAILYPQSTGNEKYTVTFDSLGGTTVSSQAVEIGGCAYVPRPNPTRDGYSFVGWYADPECTVAFDFNTPINENITLYAGWRVADEEEPLPDSGDGGDGGDSGSGNDGDSGSGGSGSDGSGTDSGDGGTGGTGSGNGSGTGLGDGSGTGSGSGSNSGFGGGQGGQGTNPYGGTGASEGAGGDDQSLALIGSREGAEGTDLGSFFSEGGSTGENQGDSAADISSGSSSEAPAIDDQSSGQSAANSLGAGDVDTDEVGTGQWNMYQIMNPYTSDLGIEVEDNPLEPFILPVTSGALAVGALESLLWFFMQRRRIDPLLASSDSDFIGA